MALVITDAQLIDELIETFVACFQKEPLIYSVISTVRPFSATLASST